MFGNVVPTAAETRGLGTGIICILPLYLMPNGAMPFFLHDACLRYASARCLFAR